MQRLPLSLPMARAFRAGRKTQTRRVSPPRFNVGDVVAIAEPCTISINASRDGVICHFATGEMRISTDPAEIARCASMPTVINRTPRGARYMPGWAERSQIRITEIREQALGDLTEADAHAEGFANVAEFMDYFGTLHRGSIDLTLPVWAISFEVVT